MTPRSSSAQGGRITPEIIALFCKSVALEEAGATEQWEEDGGRRREYLDTCHALHVALERKPWEIEVIATLGQDAPPQWMHGAHQIASWHEARAISRQLEEAVEQEVRSWRGRAI